MKVETRTKQVRRAPGSTIAEGLKSSPLSCERGTLSTNANQRKKEEGMGIDGVTRIIS